MCFRIFLGEDTEVDWEDEVFPESDVVGNQNMRGQDREKV
jgi:hypothetical protein